MEFYLKALEKSSEEVKKVLGDYEANNVEEKNWNGKKVYSIRVMGKKSNRLGKMYFDEEGNFLEVQDPLNFLPKIASEYEKFYAHH